MKEHYTVRNALVLTSISSPNPVIRELASGTVRNNWRFFLIGDVKSPTEFSCDGVSFFDIDRQLKTGFAYAQKCPVGHYARKNIGYLLAMAEGADVIVETDDDNYPYAEFWSARTRMQNTKVVAENGWTNVYRYFSDALIWPRGFPLDEIYGTQDEYESLPEETIDCPIQQGLANTNPDVDAIYRLVMTLPQTFRDDRAVALGNHAWCPFNSQNTTWWREAYPLLYLPAYCSFRMCDIWRGFVAQRIAWANGWHVLFHKATVWQERNSHDLMADFDQEVVGYLQNKRIADTLEQLPIKSGVKHIPDNLMACYEALARMNLVGSGELDLLEAWLSDVSMLEAR